MCLENNSTPLNNIRTACWVEIFTWIWCICYQNKDVEAIRRTYEKQKLKIIFTLNQTKIENVWHLISNLVFMRNNCFKSLSVFLFWLWHYDAFQTQKEGKPHCWALSFSVNVCVLGFRDRRERHRSKSRDSSSRGDKSVTIQTPGEPLLDAESTRGDDRVSLTDLSVCKPLHPRWLMFNLRNYPCRLIIYSQPG